MEFGVNTKGWTVIDCSDGPSLCAVSLKTDVRASERPQVLAVAEHTAESANPDAATLRELLSRVERSLPVLMMWTPANTWWRMHPRARVAERQTLRT